MATVQNPKWTTQHDDALAALLALKVPKKEAQKALEGMEGDDSGELVKAMLRSRSRGLGRAPVVPPGGPQNAMLVNPVPSATGAPPPAPAAPQARPSMLRSFVPKPPQIASAPAAQVPRINLRGFTPQQQSPATAQLSMPSMSAPSPTQPAMPGPGGEKPRIRVRAAGGPVPAAPLGGPGPAVGPGAVPNAPAGPAAAPQKPAAQPAALPRIRSEEEYEKLAPGSRFVWSPDGHIYRKPAEGGEE